MRQFTRATRLIECLANKKQSASIRPPHRSVPLSAHLHPSWRPVRSCSPFDDRVPCEPFNDRMTCHSRTRPLAVTVTGVYIPIYRPISRWHGTVVMEKADTPLPLPAGTCYGDSALHDTRLVACEVGKLLSRYKYIVLFPCNPKPFRFPFSFAPSPHSASWTKRYSNPS